MRRTNAIPNLRVPSRFRSNPLLAVATAAVLVAATCAAWFGWSWYSAANSASLSNGRARDAALQAGEQAIQNLNTLDYRKVDQGFSIWLQSTTGTLHSYFEQGRTQFEQAVRQAKTVTTARILDGAVTALDSRAGTASIMAAVQITVTPASGKPAIKDERLDGQLTQTGSGWKLSNIQDMPVPAASPAPTTSASP